MTQKKSVIVYCSPAGTTGHVAEVIKNKLEALNTEVSVLDTSKEKNYDSIISQIKNAKENVCLYIGSPVYVSHAVPPVMDFISQLPENTGAYAVPFVTWGGATSGIALHEMGSALTQKGIKLIGAAKVMALHSMMWKADNPLGQGSPNTDDDKLIDKLVVKISEKLKTNLPNELSINDLAYLPEKVRNEMAKVNLEMAKSHMPERQIDEKLCTQCEVCAEVCPTDAISFSPYPEFGKSCICCFNCVRLCPEEAIISDLSVLEGRIRERAKQMAEQPLTQIFL